MTEDEFAAKALALPEAVESSHQGARDWRVRKKVFATCDSAQGLAGLKLTPEQQALLIDASPAFFPANGAWGARGWTKATLKTAPDADLTAALRMSWTNTAPKTLTRQMTSTRESVE